jgi:hypothetical protein
MIVVPVGNRTRPGARLMLKERWDAPPSPTKARWRKCLPAANRKKQMKKTVISIALAIAAPFAWAQVSETTTTTTTTEGNGTITQYTPGSVIVLKESSGPRTYHFGKTVTYVTRSGKVLDEDVVRTRVKVGAPVRVHYVGTGDNVMVDRVILDED